MREEVGLATLEMEGIYVRLVGLGLRVIQESFEFLLLL